MNVHTKTRVLKDLDTKSLTSRMYQLENDLEQALSEEAKFKHDNASYLSSYSSDCKAVDEIMAGLRPPAELGKLTVDQRKSWLTEQRTENPELKQAIEKQQDVAFQNENNRIKVDMLVKRLEGVHAVLSLKTAQIKFLTEG